MNILLKGLTLAIASGTCLFVSIFLFATKGAQMWVVFSWLIASVSSAVATILMLVYDSGFRERPEKFWESLSYLSLGLSATALVIMVSARPTTFYIAGFNVPDAGVWTFAMFFFLASFYLCKRKGEMEKKEPA